MSTFGVGVGSGRMYHVPIAPGGTKFRYYCPAVQRYYPEVAECPSGFRGVPE